MAAIIDGTKNNVRPIRGIKTEVITVIPTNIVTQTAITNEARIPMITTISNMLPSFNADYRVQN